MESNYIKFSILLISTILLQSIATAFAAEQSTDQFILPSDGQKDQAFHMVVIGDSIAWGNGLQRENKYPYLVADWLQKALNRPVDVTVYAHSGATISGESGKSIDPNLNSGSPTLTAQANNIQDKSDVDLILVSGGINDVGVLSIIDPEKTALEISDLSKETKIPMKELLEKLLSECDNARIVVTGYYPIITEDIADKNLDIVYELFYQLGRSNTILATNYKAVLVANSQAFSKYSSESLNNAISEINSDRVTFVPVDFPSDKCYGTENSWLWKLISLIPPKTDDDQFEYRSSLSGNIKDPVEATVNTVNAIGHPNRYGATEYARAIESVIDSKGSDWLQNESTVNDGYSTNSWEQEITETDTKNAFLQPNNKSTVPAIPISQTPGKYWNKTFGEDFMHAEEVRQTNDGGYILAGLTLSFGTNDGWLIKTDSDGNMIWNKTFADGYDITLHSIKQTSDGGYIIAGRKSAMANDACMWLIKADSDGNILWDKTFCGESWDTAKSVQQTSDGGYIMCGLIGSKHYTSKNVYEIQLDGKLIKTDSDGNMLWEKTFGGPYDDLVEAVQQTTDGGYIIVGSTKSFGAGSLDAWLIKADSDGNVLWNKTFGGSGWDGAYSVQQTSDGGYIIAGSIYNNIQGTVSDDIIEPDKKVTDAWLIKTDSDGNMLWNKTLRRGLSSYWNNAAYSVQQTNDSGYIVAGTFEVSIGDFWLIKTDSDGNMLWNETFGSKSCDEDAYSVQQTSDGGYILTGSSGCKSDGAWLIKTDANEITSISSIQQTSDGGYILGSDDQSSGPWLVKEDVTDTGNNPASGTDTQEQQEANTEGESAKTQSGIQEEVVTSKAPGFGGILAIAALLCIFMLWKEK